MMRFLILVTVMVWGLAAPTQAQTTVKVGFCARTVSAAAAPFAIATKFGWFAEKGIKVDLVPLPGSTDCVKLVATGEIPYSIPSIEPVAIIRALGVKVVNFYTAYQGNIYGMAVPADSPIKTLDDLKGKTIGVTSMASGGVLTARALVANRGLDPTKDVRIVVAGEGAQTAALLRSNQIDAISQFDTQYTLVENAGAALRYLDVGELASYPSNGFVATEDVLSKRRGDAVALGQGYAKGTIFAMANPEAAIRILYEVYPFTRATGKDEATAIADDIKTLNARAKNWRLEAGRVSKWGENNVANYQAYLDFLLKWNVLKEKANASELVSNELIADINAFDQAAIAAQAKAYK